MMKNTCEGECVVGGRGGDSNTYSAIHDSVIGTLFINIYCLKYVKIYYQVTIFSYLFAKNKFSKVVFFFCRIFNPCQKY